MASVTETLHLSVAAPDIWNVIGDFNGLARWHPAIEGCQVTGEGVGSIRTLEVVGGLRIVEELKDYQPGTSYSYSILEGPLPVKNYFSCLSVSAGPDGSIVTWESSFEADGVPDEIAESAVRDIYMAGLTAIRKHFSEAR